MKLRCCLLVAAALAGWACEPKHVEVDAVEELGYPSCGEAPLAAGRVVASGALRAGPHMRDKEVVEQYELRERDCLFVGRASQEWRLARNDIEVVYDAQLRPLRIWKRMEAQGSDTGKVDIRRYELRTRQVGIKRRKPDGSLRHEVLRGPRPEAVIAPGHGLLTAWIRRAGLEVGEKERVPALDIRKHIEVIEEVTLRRDPDRYEPSLGRKVRVYTIYGRESVFADETDAVIGDLAGLRPYADIEGREPPPLADFGALHPRNSP